MKTIEHEASEMISANSAAYTKIVDEWDKAWGEKNEKNHAPCRELFIQHLNGSRVLDVGCGLGRDSLFFQSNGLDVYAADLVTGFLSNIRRSNTSVRAFAMDVTTPCIADSVFDGIFAFASFLHVPRPMSLETLKAYRSMLKPGGILFLYHVASRKGFGTYKVDNLLIENNPAFCTCHDEDELTGLITGAGFASSEIIHLTKIDKPSETAVKYGLEPYQVLAWK